MMMPAKRETHKNRSSNNNKMRMKNFIAQRIKLELKKRKRRLLRKKISMRMILDNKTKKWRTRKSKKTKNQI